MLERFTVIEGELTVKLDGATSVLGEGQTSEVQHGQWHDWWNAADADALVRVEAEPGEWFDARDRDPWGLALLGHTNAKGMPDPLQLAVFGREFADMIQFRNPPPAVQRVMFALLSLVAGPMGYRGHLPPAVTHRGRTPGDLSSPSGLPADRRRLGSPGPPAARGPVGTIAEARLAALTRTCQGARSA